MFARVVVETGLGLDFRSGFEASSPPCIQYHKSLFKAGLGLGMPGLDYNPHVFLQILEEEICEFADYIGLFSAYHAQVCTIGLSPFEANYSVDRSILCMRLIKCFASLLKVNKKSTFV